MLFWGCFEDVTGSASLGEFPAAPQVQQPSSRPGHSGRGWHLGCEECCGGWDVLLCQWDSESPVLWDPLCTPERLWEGTPRLLTQAGLCWAPSSTATSHRSHCKTGLGLSFLTASGKINVLILRVSSSELFPVGLESASPVGTGQTAALCGTHLSLPWVPRISHFSYLYSFPSPGWTSGSHSSPSEQTGRWQQLQSELPTKANRTSSHPKSHTQLSPGLE